MAEPTASPVPVRHAVTGAFGYSGSYMARKLLDAGHQVMTLTNSPAGASPLAGRVTPVPFHFDDPEKLAESLHGVEVLYNTYWVRFNHRWFTHGEAVANTQTLFAAARKAGVKRVVHVSITNPSEDSELEYFRGKAILERTLRESGLSYAILRPAVLFGDRDILVNNIAWALRRLPVFGVFGDGAYKLQPIHVEDLADLAVAQGATRENVTIDAIGPETFTYRGLVQNIGEIVGQRRLIIRVSPAIGYAIGWCIGKCVRDVLLTREEIEGLMANLLYVDAPPTGTTRLTDWAERHANELGTTYSNEIARRQKPAR